MVDPAKIFFLGGGGVGTCDPSTLKVHGHESEARVSQCGL